ncbi:NAD(P)-dependent oxidoreductase [Nereida sp. MMG025]|uniref:NAD-dependent epimerase/dehydratase family protein n=1 Tax=Nereida sp. MMG025 TaxID=2909981 RepID=UPI001F1BBE59|nr:NAD(P)-dependent oxidoreductase [Nereida sp. MMG025]MCF6443739.1 NAD(P)-dependent oxidoreductase [Nereida sp. MMG025]
MSRVLVTGATGFLGGACLRKLRARGYDVVATGRNPKLCAALKVEGITTICADLGDAKPQELAAALGAERITAVLHCAGLSAPFGRLSAFMTSNVSATRTLLAASKAVGVGRFVYVSSPTVGFAFRDCLNQSEDMPRPRPVNYYAKTKAIAENLVLDAADVGPVVLRPRGLYGQGERTLLPRMLRAAQAGPLPVFRDGVACMDLTHIDDAVDACVAALGAGDQAEGEIINVSGGDVRGVREIVDRACAKMEFAPRWRKAPLRPALALAGLLERAALLRATPAEPRVTRYSIGLFAYAQSLNLEKAACLLQWHPRIDFDEGLERTFARSPLERAQ